MTESDTSAGPTVSFGFNLAKVVGHGEDSDPILRDGPDVGLAAVFDGMGGAGGTVYDTADGQRSGAYLASRIARTVVEDHLLQVLVPDQPRPGGVIATELHDVTEGALQTALADLKAPSSRLRSRLLRALPTTMAEIGVTGKQACEGDSGGPAFMTIDGVMTLIATDDLAATSKDCQGGDLYQRVDLQLDFIDTYLGTTTTDTGDPNGADATDTASTDGTSSPTYDPTQTASGDDDDSQTASNNDPNTPGTPAFCQLNPDDDSCATDTANAHSLRRKK